MCLDNDDSISLAKSCSFMDPSRKMIQLFGPPPLRTIFLVFLVSVRVFSLIKLFATFIQQVGLQ